jgi:hypothetical protein
MPEPGLASGYPTSPPPRQQATTPRPGDERLYVVFYPRTELNGFESKKEGRPIYHDVDYVRIHIPGDKFTIIDKKVGDEERTRFPQQWARYASTKTNSAPEGFPLAEWAMITRSQAEELKHFHVFTVEQLATLPDQYGQRFQGFFELRRKAIAYLAQAKDESFAAKVAVENDDLRKQIETQQQMMQKMSEAITQLQSAKEPPHADELAVGRTGRK